VVTPLQDGMNLVPRNMSPRKIRKIPAVLVLSNMPAPANELDAALLVTRMTSTAWRAPLRPRFDAADRTADALGSDDDETAQPHHPAVVPPISSTRCRKVSLKKAFGRSYLNRRPVAASFGQWRRAVSLSLKRTPANLLLILRS